MKTLNLNLSFGFIKCEISYNISFTNLKKKKKRV